jgi:hypothetical protein
MVPEFIFEWVALNPRAATSILFGFTGLCSAAAWTGFILEMRKGDDDERGN